jgi:hypothetical protein
VIVAHHWTTRAPPQKEKNIMQSERDHTKPNSHINLIAILLAAAFLVTAGAISPARANDEHHGHGNDHHHKQKGHDKHWHAYPEHVYYPPPVVYAPQPYYSPPPPLINIVIPFPH